MISKAKSGFRKLSGGAEINIEEKILGSSFWQFALVLLPILVVAYLAFGLFFVPAIFLDDWTSVIERVITGNAQWLDLSENRPFLFTPFVIQYRMFDLNLDVYYIILWSMYVLMAILVYKIINCLPVENSRLFGLIIALLFLVYPTNYTHMYLIQLGIYSAISLALLYGYLLSKFAVGGHWYHLALASTCLLISFGLYEAQAGVAALWAFILVAVFRQSTWKRYLSLLFPVGLIGAFSLWRTLGHQLVGINNQYISRIIASPGELLNRLILGYKISVGWGWTHPIEQFIPIVSGAKFAALLLILLITGILWIGSKAASHFPTLEQINEGVAGGVPMNKRWPMMRTYVFSAAIGLVLIGAGYIPVLLVFLPSLAGIGSRFNIMATIGGAVFFASIIMIGSLIFTKSQQHIKPLFLASAAPLILIGIVTQATVQYDHRTAWHEQQTIWQEMFLTAPSFKNDTMVLIVLPGYQDRAGYLNWRQTPLGASWEVSSAARLLYNNPTLSADILFPDLDAPTEPMLTADGVVTWDTGSLTPYNEIVAFSYDNPTYTLEQLDNLPLGVVQGFEQSVELCADCPPFKRSGSSPTKFSSIVGLQRQIPPQVAMSTEIRL